MKKIKFELLAWLFLLIVPTHVSGQNKPAQPLSFEEAFQLMEQNNPGLQQKKEQVKQKEFEQKVKRGMRLPTVSLNAQAITMSQTISMDLSPVRDAIVPLYTTLGNFGDFSGVPNPDPNTNTEMPILPDDVSTQVVRDNLLEAGQEIQSADWEEVIQDKSFAVASAGFLWPVFSGGKIQGANQAANVNLNISKEEVRQEEGDLLNELVERYYGLELGLQVCKVREQMLENMEKHYQDAKKLYDNGIIAKVELLHAEVSRNEAEREYKQAARNLEIIRSGLASTLSNDTLGQVLPTSHLFINKQINELPQWIATAKTYNPQLRQIQGKKELINIQNKVDKGAYLPTIAMFGNYNIVNKNLSPYIPDWIVGVGLNWTVFDGMSRSNKIKVSNTMQQQVEFAEEQANNNLEAYLSKLYQELLMQMEQKQELQSTLALATEYSASTEKAFNQGLATSTSVVDAYVKVAQVKALSLKVMYDYDVALARFLQASGTPAEFITYCSGENTISESL